ncbi:MAG: flippase [Nanoarchaeota archaeon]|nr:flippase [Nanoarchaeota archaeon]
MNELEDYAIKKVAKGGFIIFIGIIFSSIAFLFYKILAARYLGPADYGLLTLGITILNVASLFGLVGIHQSIGKFINHYLAKKQYEKVKGLLISSFIITISLSIVILLFLYYSSNIIAEKIFNIQGLNTIIAIFSLGVPFSVLTQLLKYYFFAFKKPEFVIISESVFEKILNLVLLIAVISVSASLYAISWVYVVSLIVSFMIGTLLLTSKVKDILKKSLKPKFDFKQLISFSSPLILVGILGTALAWTDTIFIGIFKSSTDVGIYNVAYIIASALMIFWMSFGDIFYPIISELYAKKAKNLIRKNFEIVSRWIFIIAFPLFIIVLVFPSPIISLVFGEDYQGAALPLSILIIGYFIITAFGLAEQGLRTFKKTKFLGVLTLFVFLMNVILNIILIPLIGIVGAAIATTFSLLILSLVRLTYFRRMLKFGYNKILYSKFIFSSMIALVTFFYGIRLVNAYNIYIFISALAAYMLIYFILLIIFKSFSEDDIAILEAVERKIGIEFTVLKKLLR